MANDSALRKNSPVFSGVMMYFPDALIAISQHSKAGNEKHNPGQPLHWAKDKSKDQADCISRHLIDIGPNWDAIDEETGSFHAVALAWRSLALLQTLLERKKEPTKETPKYIKPTPTPTNGTLVYGNDRLSPEEIKECAKLDGQSLLDKILELTTPKGESYVSNRTKSKSSRKAKVSRRRNSRVR